MFIFSSSLVLPSEMIALTNLTELSVSNIHVSATGELSVGYRKTIEEQQQQSLQPIKANELLSLTRFVIFMYLLCFK
jgi:hypothetical protein